MTDAHHLPVFDESAARELARPEAGPKRTTTLHARRSPLVSPSYQIRTLESVDLEHAPFAGNFAATLENGIVEGLQADSVEVFQINLGKLCNMTCRHCHVDAGPDRWQEVMDLATVDACLRALDATNAHTVDITGGAPELNPHFRYLVDECASRGKRVIDRCNLTVLLLPRNRDLPEYLAERRVEVVCSLPHYRKRNTDAQRGHGTFEKSIEALRRLNAAGYSGDNPELRLTLMVNPVGAVLTGDQRSMEREWKRGLERNHGVTFDRLIALNNMPIARFLEWLEDSGNLEVYMELLVNTFNPATVDGLMCRNTLSISWDGGVYDCDFNQMLDLGTRVNGSARLHVSDIDSGELTGRPIVTGRHCFGCTAGAGSSCGGAIDT
jgi:radical SAM/Cys-rich protein